VINRALRSSQDIYLCAEFDGALAGFCSLAIKNSLGQEANIGILLEMVVYEAFRKRGIGTALLGTIVDMARQRGCRLVELDSAFHHEEAHRFYEKAGFEKKAHLFTKEL
jgi:glucosamine-phosphate N-acetyltransferase